MAALSRVVQRRAEWVDYEHDHDYYCEMGRAVRIDFEHDYDYETGIAAREPISGAILAGSRPA